MLSRTPQLEQFRCGKDVPVLGRAKMSFYFVACWLFQLPLFSVATPFAADSAPATDRPKSTGDGPKSTEDPEKQNAAKKRRNKR